MVLVKIWKCFERFVLCKRHPENVFGDVVVRKQSFLENINMDLKRRQNCIFAKGIVHRFDQKFEISPTLIFMQNRLRQSIWERSS